MVGRFADGTELRVAAEEWIPYTAVRTLDNGTVLVRGAMGALLDLLSSALNFRLGVGDDSPKPAKCR